MSNSSNSKNKNNNLKVDELSRPKELFTQVLIEFKKRHMDVYKLKDETKVLLNKISQILIQVAETKCKYELSIVNKYFNSVYDHSYGIYFEKIEKKFSENPADANGALFTFERCLDRHTGINKKISMFEMDSKNINVKNKSCLKNCEKSADSMSDDILKECFFGCVNEFLESSSNLQNQYNQNLQNILNKF